MEQYFLLTTTLLLGFIGSLHCATMCAGIVSMLRSPTSQKGGKSYAKSLYTLAYHAGRITSYAAAGAIASGFGDTMVNLVGQDRSHVFMQMITGLFLLLLGLSLIGWWNGLSLIETSGFRIWKYVQPLAKTILPITHPGGAFLAGIFWGWLPCGLVYTALILVLSAGDMILGAAAMVAFGVGTLPMLLFVSFLSKHIHSLGRQSTLRKSVGYAMIIFGVIIFTGMPQLQYEDHALSHQTQNS